MSVTTTRREREIIEMRQLIVNTAMQMYLEEGYDKLSLRGIATRIEYAVGTIYLYFKDKHELFHAMHEAAFEKLLVEFDPLHNIENPLERLRALSRVFVNFALKNPELYDLMFILHEPMCADENIEDWHCGRRAFVFLHETVRDCIEQRYVKGDDVNIVSFAFMSATHGMLALKMRNRMRMYGEIDTENMIRATQDLVLAQFLR
jgi:AcrR family transcriptional regulator